MSSLLASTGKLPTQTVSLNMSVIDPVVRTQRSVLVCSHAACAVAAPSIICSPVRSGLWCRLIRRDTSNKPSLSQACYIVSSVTASAGMYSRHSIGLLCLTYNSFKILCQGRTLSAPGMEAEKETGLYWSTFQLQLLLQQTHLKASSPGPLVPPIL